jgi:hypothetical protein
MESVGPQRTKNDQRFDRAAAVAEVSVNLEIDVERMRLSLGESSLGAAYRTRV